MIPLIKVDPPVVIAAYIWSKMFDDDNLIGLVWMCKV